MSGIEQIKNKLSNLNVAIVSHIFVTGPCHELEEFLKERVKSLAFVGLPFPYSKINRSFLIYHQGGKVKQQLPGPSNKALNPFYLKDVLFIFYCIFKTRQRFDIFVGINNLNAFCGLLLKKMGRVKKVIFYTIDYIPQRFKSPVLNRLYHLIDRICCYRCDCVWNLSAVMAKERDKRGVSEKSSARQIVVPIGNNFNRIKRYPIEGINRFDLVYMGHLREGQGIELVIAALPGILKVVPQLRFVVIGTGHLEEGLKNRVRQLGLNSQVIFKGFIKDIKEVEAILAKCAIAVAPYALDPKGFTQYTDPGKPKTYLAAGLPVIMTRISQIAGDIEENGAGIIINYNEAQLADAVIKLTRDDAVYKRYRDNAIRFAANFTWEKIFFRAFAESLD